MGLWKILDYKGVGVIAHYPSATKNQKWLVIISLIITIFLIIYVCDINVVYAEGEEMLYSANAGARRQPRVIDLKDIVGDRSEGGKLIKRDGGKHLYEFYQFSDEELRSARRLRHAISTLLTEENYRFYEISLALYDNYVFAAMIYQDDPHRFYDMDAYGPFEHYCTFEWLNCGGHIVRMIYFNTYYLQFFDQNGFLDYLETIDILFEERCPVNLKNVSDPLRELVVHDHLVCLQDLTVLYTDLCTNTFDDIVHHGVPMVKRKVNQQWITQEEGKEQCVAVGNRGEKLIQMYKAQHILHGAKLATKLNKNDFVVFPDFLEREDGNLVDNGYDYRLAYQGWYDHDQHVFEAEDFFVRAIEKMYKDIDLTQRGYFKLMPEKKLLNLAHKNIFPVEKIRLLPEGEKKPINIDRYNDFLAFTDEFFQHRRARYTADKLVLGANKTWLGLTLHFKLNDPWHYGKTSYFDIDDAGFFLTHGMVNDPTLYEVNNDNDNVIDITEEDLKKGYYHSFKKWENTSLYARGERFQLVNPERPLNLGILFVSLGIMLETYIRGGGFF